MLAMANWLRNLQWHSDDIEMTRTIYIYGICCSCFAAAIHYKFESDLSDSEWASARDTCTTIPIRFVKINRFVWRIVFYWPTKSDLTVYWPCSSNASHMHSHWYIYIGTSHTISDGTARALQSYTSQITVNPSNVWYAYIYDVYVNRIRCNLSLDLSRNACVQRAVQSIKCTSQHD